MRTAAAIESIGVSSTFNQIAEGSPRQKNTGRPNPLKGLDPTDGDQAHNFYTNNNSSQKKIDELQNEDNSSSADQTLLILQQEEERKSMSFLPSGDPLKSPSVIHGIKPKNQ